MPKDDTILVVEDEDQARTFLTEILNFEGFKALGFANGAEALDYLRTSAAPCLIVLDILMPVMDGRQFRAAMLQQPRFAEIPVVVVTALDSSTADDLKAVRVLRKPLDIGALLNVVRANC
ncbi:MAG TPA: response regulator [Candidatus Binataceae bacterium]|jgi:CheY-like chemotaxis protein|nr:response regulator [Candidatus Binataceae bacterium]